MPKVKISEYSATANSNTDVASINIDEGCAPSGINNAIRAVMGHLKDFQQGTYGDPFNGPVNGTLGATTASTANVTTLTTSSTVTHNGGTANGVAYLNGSKVLTTGSALVFDGTNLGVGAATPTAKLHIGVASAAVDGTKGVRITNPAGTVVMLECGNGGDSFVGTTSGSDFNIRTGNVTRATFDNSGNLLVGTTNSSGSSGNGVKLIKDRSGTSGYNSISTVSTATDAGMSSYELYTAAGGAGYKFYVFYNGGIANYSANNVNLSDRREKTNFAPAKSYLDVICAIPVQTFHYINQNLEQDPDLTLGVVAQDVQAVAPELVAETKIGTGGEGEKRLAIYQTDLQYALMKCIQEMKAIIDTQASTITQLQADVALLKGA